MGLENSSIGGYFKKLALANDAEEKNEVLRIVNALISSHNEKNLLTALLCEAKKGNNTAILRNQVTPPPDLSNEGITSQIDGRDVEFFW